MEQRSEEWFAARKGRITASMVGAILGVAPYLTRDGAMRRMVREREGAESEFTGNIATSYGEANEDGAVAEYTMETGNAVDAVGFITREDWREGWAGCSPDGLIGADGGLEAKCPFGKRKGGDLKPLADQPHYYAQVQFSLWVTGRAWWDFYQWSPGQTKLERVTPDQSWLDKNLPRLRQFYAEYLAEPAEPHIMPKRVDVDTLEAARIMAEYDQLAEAIENAEARRKELLAEMVRLAGEKDAVFAGRNLTKINKVGSISYAKALAELAPGAILDKWRGKPSSYWVVK